MKSSPALLLSLITVFLIHACSSDNETMDHKATSSGPTENQPGMITRPDFQSLLDSNDVQGSILIFHATTSIFYSNDFQWANRGFLPASTFKIPNSMIALELGNVEDEATMFPWDGKPRRMTIWEEDLTFEQAFKRSCVPCYQQLARTAGADSMNNWLRRLDYGEMYVSPKNIDMFWLEGESIISQFEQIDFLNRFRNQTLPLKQRTYETMRTLMLLEDKEDYRFYGKTGWSIRNGNNNGWFVGFVENGNDNWVFATNIIPNEAFKMDLFAKIRVNLTQTALEHLDALPTLDK